MAKHKTSGFQPFALSLMRLIVGFTFWLHGLQKLFGMFGAHRAEMWTLAWTGGVLEGIGGLLILLGLGTRLTAFVLCGEMAVAYFMQHAPGGFLPIVNHGELAVLYCFVFLYLFAAGPGPLSLDAVIFKRD